MSSEWTERQLGEVLSIKHGYAFPGAGFNEDLGLPTLVTPGNFRIGGGFQQTKPKTFAGEYPEAFRLVPGDVIVTMTDLSRNADTLGYTATVPDDGRTYLHNQRIGKVVITDPAAVDYVFIAYLLRTRRYRDFVVGSASGSTVKHTSPSRIESFTAKLPSLPEQQRIASVLSALDDLIDANQRAVSATRDLSRALYQRLVGCVQSDVVLGEVARVNDMRTKPSDGTIRYVDIAAMNDGTLEFPRSIDWTEAPSRARMKATSGSTLWSTVRPNRRAHALLVQAPDDLVVSTGIAVLTPTSIGPAELFAASDQDDFVDQLVSKAEGSAYPALRPAAFNEVRIAALEPEQSAHFEQTMWPLWLDAHAASEDNARLTRARGELLPLLMSGRVRVPEDLAVA